MKCRYITIEREYGSGGTSIAHLLSEQTGVPCYGREILEKVAREQNVSMDRMQSYEESVTNSFLYSLYMMSQTAAVSNDMLTKDGHIYVAEQTAIQQLAAKGPAIFLGHCACEALKDRKGVVNVFIRCTDEQAKRQRIMVDYQVPAAQVDTFKRKFDKKRANYYHANTSKKWDDLKNYDIVLDSGILGIEGCVNALKSLIG